MLDTAMSCRAGSEHGPQSGSDCPTGDRKPCRGCLTCTSARATLANRPQLAYLYLFVMRARCAARATLLRRRRWRQTVARMLASRRGRRPGRCRGASGSSTRGARYRWDRESWLCAAQRLSAGVPARCGRPWHMSSAGLGCAGAGRARSCPRHAATSMREGTEVREGRRVYEPVGEWCMWTIEKPVQAGCVRGAAADCQDQVQHTAVV